MGIVDDALLDEPLQGVFRLGLYSITKTAFDAFQNPIWKLDCLNFWHHGIDFGLKFDILIVTV